MNVALWIAQTLLALVYLAAGGMKTTQPIDALGKRLNWVKGSPVGFVRFIGIAEVLGALGVVLPLLTGVFPWLTIVAAAGLALVQVFAAGFHLSRGEVSPLPMNAILLLLAAFVAYGRWIVLPA